MAAPSQVAVDAFCRDTNHAITGIHSGALKLSRIALVNGIIVIATNRAYQQAVPLAARRIWRLSFSVRSGSQPPRSAIRAMNRRAIRFWKSTKNPVHVSWPATFPSALMTATQRNDAVVRAPPKTMDSGL